MDKHTANLMLAAVKELSNHASTEATEHSLKHDEVTARALMRASRLLNEAGSNLSLAAYELHIFDGDEHNKWLHRLPF